MTRSRSGSNVSMMSSNSVQKSVASSSASSSLGFGSFLNGGSSIPLAEYSIATNINADEVARDFQKMLMEMRTVGPARDPSSIRRVACCAALMETAEEEQRRVGTAAKQGSDSDNDNIHDIAHEITPNGMFIVTITALTSLQASLEARQKSLSSSSTTTATNSNNEDVLESISLDIQNTALPLLEILRRTLPYVANTTNNYGMLLLHQFGSLSRMMRMFVALGYALPATSAISLAGDGSGRLREEKRKEKKRKQSSSSSNQMHPQSGIDGSAAVTGANALLRQVLKVSTTLLLVTPPHNHQNLISEKDVAKLLHTTIVPMFHDVRPKVRKAAWGCGMEIIVVASSSSSLPSRESADIDTENNDTGRMMAKMQLQQRKIAADFLWEYCQAVLTNYAPSSLSSSSGSKDKSSKVIHVLRFLSGALTYADDERIRVRFGECCLTMLTGGSGCNSGGGGEDSTVGKTAIVPGEVGKEILVTLLSCLEMTEQEQESQEDESVGQQKDDFTTQPTENMSKFAAKTLTFLLQHRPSSSSYSNDWQDMNAMYGRCMLVCMERMMSISSNVGIESDVVPAPKLLAMKLFPSVVGSMLHLCEGTGDPNNGERGNERSNHPVTSCGSEFNQLLSRMMPIIVSFLDLHRSNATLQRLSLEILPQCVTIIQQALQLKYRSAWGSILSGGYSTFISTIARFLLELRFSSSSTSGIASKDIAELEDKLYSWVQKLVLSLLRLHDDVESGDGTARTAVEYATTTIIRDIGVELFLSMVDFLNDDGSGDLENNAMSGSSGIRDDRVWLLSLMKQSTDGLRRNTTMGDDCISLKTHLSFFQGNVLNLARKCDAATADGHRTAAEISIQKARVVELWSLFPSFCVCPMDMKENFESVAKTVLRAIGDYARYPALIQIICGGLKIVAIGVTERNKASPNRTDDYDVLSNVSTKILPSLFKLVETLNESFAKKSDGDTQSMGLQHVEAVTDAIGQLAQICPREFLQILFKKVVQRLLVATTEVTDIQVDKESTRATLRLTSLLGLAQALVASSSLDDASLSLLYRAVRPLVRSDEHDPKVQKRAYKVLAEICERHKDFVTSEERLGEMTILMVDSIVTCQVSARHMRIKCMTHIVEGFDSENLAHMAVIPKIISEVLLCLKDSNAKTRDAAYQLLLAMSVARNDMTDFFRIILAALGAQTTHMRSAAVMALSRLIFEYARVDHTVQELLPSLMQTVSVLFDDSSREVTKSVIGFVRVSVAAMSQEQLAPLLPEVVGGIMKYNKCAERFRAKIKIILKKLVRVYGYETIKSFVPAEHSRLITHMRKLSERAVRRKVAGVQDGHSDIHHGFDNMMDSDEDDSDDGRTFMTGVTGFTKMTSMSGKSARCSTMDRTVVGKGVGHDANSTATSKRVSENGRPRIMKELNGEILDMLDDSKMARSVHFADVDANDNEDDDDGDEDFEYDSLGRIVISDCVSMSSGKLMVKEQNDSDDDGLVERNDHGKRRRISKFETAKLIKSDTAKGTNQKFGRNPTTSFGDAYKSKKAGGDVKKKGQKYEPYAYVPLDAKDYTKKNRSKAVSKMSSVVRNTKRKRE